jgi:hypothetical protein
VLNKTDYLQPAELAQALAFASDAIRQVLGMLVPVFPVSARLAIEGKQAKDTSLLERSGFLDLEQALRTFIAKERTDTWLRSVSRSLLSLLARARHALALERQALSEPLERIQNNLAAFQARRADVQRSRADHQVLLEADARALMREDIEPALERFKKEQIERLPAYVDEWHLALWTLPSPRLPSRTLQAELEKRIIDEVRTAYDSWLLREDAHLAEAFDASCRRFWENLQKTIDELMRYSSELFALSWTRADLEGGWSTQSGFYYKFWYEPTSLRILSVSIVLRLPKPLAGKLIVRRMKRLAAELIETQAGRIRHDLEERLKQSVHDARRRMSQSADAMISRIEAAIESAISTRRQSESHVEARRAEITRIDECLTTIEARVRESAP